VVTTGQWHCGLTGYDRYALIPGMQVDAYIALGSNQGDRELYLLRAIAEIGRSPGCKVTAISSFYETSPVGNVNQPPFYNAVIKVDTNLSPVTLLDTLLSIETESFGRVRTIRWGARSIDLDLLLYGDCIMNTSHLTLPHPRLHERRFVLQPLDEIAPQLLHPLLQRTVHELLAEQNSDETVIKL